MKALSTLRWALTVPLAVVAAPVALLAVVALGTMADRDEERTGHRVPWDW